MLILKKVGELMQSEPGAELQGRREGKLDCVELMGCSRKFLFPSMLSGKPLENFKQGSDII